MDDGFDPAYARGCMDRRASWLTALVVAGASGTAAAADRVAVLPAGPAGGTSKEVLRAVNDAVDGLLGSATGIETVSGSAIKRKMRAEARACREEPACLARVGRRLKVDEVVTVRARRHGEGLRLTFLAVGVEDRRLRRTVSVTVDSTVGIAAVVRVRLGQILGVTQAELTAAVEPEVDELLPLEPMPSLEPLPGAGELGAAPEEPPPAPAVIAEPTPASATKDVAAVEPVRPGRPLAEPSRWMWYSGLGMLGAGAVLGGVSTFFGVRYFSKKNAIDEGGRGTTPQVRAEALQDQANRAGKLSNISAVAAAVLAAAGAGLVIADLVSEDVSVHVDVRGDGGQAGLMLLW